METDNKSPESGAPSSSPKRHLLTLIVGATYGIFIVVILVEGQIAFSNYLQRSLMNEHDLSEDKYVEHANRYDEILSKFLRSGYANRIRHSALGCALAAFLIAVTAQKGIPVRCVAACPLILITIGWFWTMGSDYYRNLYPEIEQNVRFMQADKESRLLHEQNQVRILTE